MHPLRRASTVRAAVLALAAIPVLAPLVTIDWFESHEAASYPARIVEVRRCFEDGLLSARWFPDLAGGRGYPFLSFYAPLSFWIAGAFHASGLSAAAALKLVIALATGLGLAGAYRLAREGLSPGASLLAAVFYAYAPYHLRDLWTRGDLAEYFAMGVLPWALYATLRLRRRPAPGAAVLAGALGAAAILSHNVLGLSTGLAMLGMGVLVVTGPAAASAGKRIGAALAAGALALLLSAFFWVPALAERKWVQLENLRRGHFDVGGNFVSIADLAGVLRPTREFVPGGAEAMTYELGFVLLAALLAPWAWGAGSARTRRIVTAGAGLLGAAVFFATPASAFVYERVALLGFVGFPWRFLALAGLGAALLAGAGLGAALDGRRRAIRLAGYSAAAVLAIATVADLLRPLRELELQDWMLDPAAYRAADFTASAANEYLPVWAVRRERIPFRDGLAATGPVRFANVERGVARWSFDVEADSALTVILQDHFFPGWRATANGEEIEIVPRPGSGHAQFDVPEGRHRIRARLEPTPVRRAARWVSFAGLAVSALLLTRGRRA